MIDTEGLDAGIGEATDGYDAQEAASARQWLKRIQSAVEFDKGARENYARCRRYARGDSSFEVSVPLLASYIDILVAFIYARDPDVDVLPADRITGDRMSRVANQGALKDVRDLARTLEIVVARLFRLAKLKRRAREQTRAALTVGIGWLKATWQERQGSDPQVLQQIRDLQDNLARVQAQIDAIEDGTVENLDAAKAELEQQVAGLQSQAEIVVFRGLCIDVIAPEDMVVPECVADVMDYLDAPWLAQRLFMESEKAVSQFPKLKDKIKSATSYGHRKPEPKGYRKTPAIRDDLSDEHASPFAKGEEGDFVCVYEVWDSEANQVLTLVEGLDCYAREPFQPAKSTRFYPFFALALAEVEGERHPQSLVERSIPLIDELNRTLSAWAEHRRRTQPGTLFNAAALSEADVKKLAGGITQEMVGLTPTHGEDTAFDMNRLLVPKPYAGIDPALYDTAPTRAHLEAIWGIQEALSGTIQTAKTATEAEIQQAGTQARTGAMRDAEESMLQDLAHYVAEIALGKVTAEDAREFAGPEAMWPEQPLGIEDLGLLVNVEIRAGSTGKPNTVKEREAWAATAPLIQNAIMQIGQLRGSSPQQIADCIEEVVVETLDRAGDRMDITRFMPQEGMPLAAPVDPATGMPMAGPAPMPADVPVEEPPGAVN